LTTWVIKQATLSDALFVFRNRRGDRLEVLYRMGDGFALRYRRPERGSSRFPARDAGPAGIRGADLALILDGVDPASVRRRPRHVRPPAERPARVGSPLGGIRARRPVWSSRPDDPGGQTCVMETAGLPHDLALGHGLIREPSARFREARRRIAQLEHRPTRGGRTRRRPASAGPARWSGR
jgi:hypothetical protein